MFKFESLEWGGRARPGRRRRGPRNRHGAGPAQHGAGLHARRFLARRPRHSRRRAPRRRGIRDPSGGAAVTFRPCISSTLPARLPARLSAPSVSFPLLAVWEQSGTVAPREDLPRWQYTGPGCLCRLCSGSAGSAALSSSAVERSATVTRSTARSKRLDNVPGLVTISWSALHDDMPRFKGGP